jgi:uncharacterized protein (DUF488 family)
MEKALYTIGHSTHTADKVIALLKKHGITAVVDVRSYPYSRMNPQFNREVFSELLKEHDIIYVFLGKELGARPENPNSYVDGKVKFDLLAQTEYFKDGINRVLQGMDNYRLAIMCAEKDPLTCHRTILVCRHLVDRGINIRHILEDGSLENHDEALFRLLEELGLEARELFRTESEIIDEAYSIRGEQIAYKKSESTAEMIVREK